MAFLLSYTVGLLAGVVCFNLLPLEIRSAEFLIRVSISFIFGALMFMLLDKFILKTESNEKSPVGGTAKLGLILLLAIALDDIPEGLSIGIGSNITAKLALIIAIVLGVQNVSEGLAESAEMLEEGFSKRQVVLANLWASIVPVAMALFGTVALRGVNKHIIDDFLAFSAGAILYMTFTELAPKARLLGNLLENLGSVLGFISTYALSILLK